MRIQWSVAVVLVAMIEAVAFLVWKDKLSADVLISLISFISGGGVAHVVRANVGGTPSE